MRREHQFQPGAFDLLEDRRVPSHAGVTALAHLSAAKISADHAHVFVHVGHHGGVFVHAPGVTVSVPGFGGIDINVPGFHGHFSSPGAGVVVNVPGFYFHGPYWG